jgi:alpha-glucosidase
MTEWWRNAVVYEIYPRSFADSTGDGVGDIAGMTQRLPYLADLGCDAVWVTPWYRSPMADGGYDISDHGDIAPELGTAADAQVFIDSAHALGIRVLVDLVANHTSVEHPWFRAAKAAAPNSPERSRYWFRAGRGARSQRPPNDWASVFGGSAWSPAGDGEWYLHLFAPQQPDLNWGHPEVRAHVDDVVRLWFRRGVDGMRVDVAHGLSKDPALPDLAAAAAAGSPARDPLEIGAGQVPPDHPHWDRDENQEIFRRWRRIADEHSAPGRERVFVAEAWRIRPGGLSRYVGADRLHSAFDFDYLAARWDADDLRTRVDRHLGEMVAAGAPPTWVLGSHDIARVVTRLATESRRGRSGVPELSTADLSLGRRRATALMLFTLALPGCTYIYQGDELGLPEVDDLPDAALRDPIWERSGRQARGRDGCRVPIPWTSQEPNFGFTTGAPWLPIPAGWSALSVEAQLADDASTLATYRRALRARRQIVDRTSGDELLSWCPTGPGVLAFDRGGIRCVLNTSAVPVQVPGHSTVVGPSTENRAGSLVPAEACAWLQATG